MCASRFAGTRQEAASPDESPLRAICRLTSSGVRRREPAAAQHDQTSCGFHLRSLYPQLQSRSGSCRWSRRSTAPGQPMQTLDKRAPSRDEFLSQGRQFLKFHDLFLLKNSARCSELHQYDNVRRRCACGTRSRVTRASRYRCIRVAWARCKAGAAARFACRNRRPSPASALPSPPCARSRTLP